MTRSDDLADNISSIEERIAEAARRSGRAPDEVKLLIVTKKRDVSDIELLYQAGRREWGESYTEDIMARFEQFPQDDILWHYIGNLHKKHVNKIVGRASLIHSVSNRKLLDKINMNAGTKGIVQDILLEVNISGQWARLGFTADEVRELYETDHVGELANVCVRGLMALAPHTEVEDEIRAAFRQMKELKDQLNEKHTAALEVLSMGMSGDFELAVEEGSTMVRIGSAIFA